jgi:hypothetical protein
MVADYEAGVPLDHQKYGPLRRIRRRYQEFMEDTPLPSVPLETLTFQPLRDRG